MSGASIRLTEPVVFLVGGLEYERAHARRRRAAARLANQAPTGSTPPASPGPSSRRQSPERQPAARPSSLSRPGSRTASPAPRGRLGVLAQGDDFVPPNSRGRSHSRTRAPAATVQDRGESISRGRDGSLVREMEEAQIRLEREREEADLDEPPPAQLRGLLTVTLTKPSRIKEISIRFRGIARTDWPEGIGPRRLDVMEENTVINVTHTFFSAAQSSMTRRAASIGPGSGDHGEEARGRSSRRAASVMPGRQLSHGRSYARDSYFHEQDQPANSALAPPAAAAARASALSRISSEDELVNQVTPPIQPGEAAPTYEVAVASLPPSRAASPHRGESSGSGLTLDLSGPVTAALQRDRSYTPSRSPLGGPVITSPTHSPHSSSDRLPHLRRTVTNGSRLSHESSSSSISTHSSEAIDRPILERHPSSNPSVAASFSSDPDQNGVGWSSAPVPGSTTSSFERGRPPARKPIENGASAAGVLENGVASGGAGTGGSPSVADMQTGVAGMTFQSRSAMRQSVSPSPTPSMITDRRRRLSSSSTATARRSASVSSSTTPSAIPSAMKGKSTSGRSVSRGARFSLHGISEVLRGKSSSRTASGSLHTSGGDVSPIAEASRSNSPDGRSRGGTSRPRSQSRGRKTALKALREALTAGHAHHGLHHHGDGEHGGGDKGGVNGHGGHADVGEGWKEFRAGTYTYPIAIPVPATLPPTLSCEFGNVQYTLKATVHRAGALTSNLTASTDVVLVSTPSDEDTEENESIVVERYWETQCRYHVAISGKSFPIGGQIPISIRLNPLAKIKLYRVSAQLEQKTSYFAAVNSGRKLTRHETPKRFQLLRIEHKDPKDPLLPILSDDPNVLDDHPLKDFFINASSSDDATPSLLDPTSPWHLDGMLQLPDCATKITFSTHHEESNIAVAHNLKIMLRVERGDDEFLDSKGKRKLFDIIVETNLHILSCRLQQNLLPAYSAATPSLTGPSSSRFGRSRTTTSSTPHHDCGHQHPTPSLRNGTITAHLNPASRHHNPHEPPVATLEQNLLFARLISGETTPAGETPPTYETVVDGTAPQGAPPPVLVAEPLSMVDEEDQRGRGRSRSQARGAVAV
ncbi:hypothetical protein JCM8097_004896 [Rhodosporidiobolus ruineniae]